jgi:hypothetical protein
MATISVIISATRTPLHRVVKCKVSSPGSGIILVLEVPILSDDEDDDDNTCVESIALLVIYVEFLQGVRGTFPLESCGVLGEPSIGYLKYAILMELNPIT